MGPGFIELSIFDVILKSSQHYQERSANNSLVEPSEAPLETRIPDTLTCRDRGDSAPFRGNLRSEAITFIFYYNGYNPIGRADWDHIIHYQRRPAVRPSEWLTSALEMATPASAPSGPVQALNRLSSFA